MMIKLCSLVATKEEMSTCFSLSFHVIDAWTFLIKADGWMRGTTQDFGSKAGVVNWQLQQD